MALTLQDFLKGLDFTGLVSATGANHNQLIESAQPISDSAGEGKGLLLWTVDSALNTPIVPDPTVVGFSKWKRYLWVRIPHSTASSRAPTVYAWNDDSVSVVTYLKWLSTTADVAALQAQINTALANAASALTTAGNAVTTANAANTAAATANINATAAQATAVAAATNASTAISDAALANAAAANAQTQANTALAAAAAQKTPTAALTPGTSRQEIATNVGATAAEWFSRRDRYVKITEVQNKNTSAADSVLGKNTRVLNLEDNDSGNLATLAGSGVVTLAAGVYHIKARACAYNTPSHLLIIVKDSDNSTLLTGNAGYSTGTDMNFYDEVEGLLVLPAATAIRLDHYFSGIVVTGLGKAANRHPDAGGKEVYTTLECWLIG